MTAWAEHTAGWWALRDKPNVLFFTYEDVKKDRRGAVKQVADFMETILAPEELARVIERSSFEAMKKETAKYDPGQLVPWTTKGGGKMLRSGSTGKSGELLTPAQQARIDEACAAQLRQLRSDFPYAQYYTTH